MSDTVIQIENVSKQYRLGQVGTGTLSHDLNRWWHKVRGKEDPYLKIGEVNDRTVTGKSDYVWSLKDINFEVNRGEVLGIIGKNGAGKSTLLKILSRVTQPTTGTIKTKGRIASLLEVGTGFHPELSGRENIFLNGAILGMSKKEIQSKFDEIVDFSGVERYIDTPVKRYSSGMYVRLAFAVAAHLEPEILIVDEVLAVGDAEFQKKCLGKMKDVAGQGRTVLFVSHNMAAVKQLCQRCILLHSGSIKFDADQNTATDFYLKDVWNNEAANPEKKFEIDDNKEFQMLKVRMINVKNELTHVFECNEEINIEIVCLSRIPVKDLYGSLIVSDNEGNKVWHSYSYDILPNEADSLQPGEYRFLITIPPWTIGHGEYTVKIVFHSTQALNSYYVHSPLHELCSFIVNDNTTSVGRSRFGYFSTLLNWKLTEVK